MSLLSQFYRTTIGKKVVMALSGLILVGFVIAHMLGNLKIFTGIDPKTGMYHFDIYAHHLRAMGQEMFGYSGILWMARVVLLVAVLAHALSGIALSRLNSSAKPVMAKRAKYESANAASRSMTFGGLFLFCFIVYHILHLTLGTFHYRGFVEGQAYANVVRAFQSPYVSGFYVISMLFLTLHLYHGVWSMFQTLGVTSPAWNGWARRLAKIVALLLFLGFSAVPLSVYLGLLPLPPSIVMQMTVMGWGQG